MSYKLCIGKKKGGAACANQELTNVMERRMGSIANIFWQISYTRRKGYETINNCAASLGNKGVAHEEVAPINRNQIIYIRFNDFVNTGSLLESNRKNLRSIFQEGPQEKDQKMVKCCGRNIDISQISRKNNERNKENFCFKLLNVAIWKFLLVCNKGERTCSSDNFWGQAVGRFNSKRFFNLVVHN